MPTKHPRLCIVLDEKLYERIKLLAKIKNTSMSSMVCELIKEALDMEEDLLLAKHLKNVEKSEKNDKESLEEERGAQSKEKWEKKRNSA